TRCEQTTLQVFLLMKADSIQVDFLSLLYSNASNQSNVNGAHVPTLQKNYNELLMQL
ncbi:hypothetical protein P7K49_036483, partial [Saguinus oedipus]